MSDMENKDSLTFIHSFSNFILIVKIFSVARKAAEAAAVSANRVKSYKPCEIIEVSIVVDNPKLKYLAKMGIDQLLKVHPATRELEKCTQLLVSILHMTYALAVCSTWRKCLKDCARAPPSST